MLLDSNIIIYAVQNDNPELLELVQDPESSTSIVSYVEALGYHALEEENRQEFERYICEYPNLTAQSRYRG